MTKNEIILSLNFETSLLKKCLIFKMKYSGKQDCSYQGKALNVPTAFEGLWSISNNIKTLYEKKSG